MGKKVFIALRMAGIAGQDKLGGIFRYLGETHDWECTLVRTARELTDTRIAEALRERFDGFILSIPDTERSVAPLARANVPTIVMDVHNPSLSARKSNLVTIRNSAAAIGENAANFLMSSGRCRSYAFVHNPTLMEWSIDRFKAFRETLRDSGHWCHELANAEGLRALERPVGVFAANDDTGFDVLAYCRAHGMRVPSDALVLGINNDTLICDNCRPRLSSIQPDFEQEGFLAAKVLDEMMRARGDTPSRTLYVGVKTIVRRESTAETSISGKLVQKAVAFIRQNAQKGIGVGDVVRHLGCSRRLADLRFRELQGTSIGEAIITERLNAVRRLLTTTHETIDSIGASCGYDNPNYLKNLFRKRFGMTMRDFRRSTHGGRTAQGGI